MEREKTKPKGIYKVGNIYYITYYEGAKKYEKAIGSKLSIALKEKMDREKKGRRGTYEVLERQEKTSFRQLVDLYEKEGELRHTTANLMPRKGVPALVIKDQFKHNNVRTTVDFYIGQDVDPPREMIEKLILNSGKLVGKDESSKPAQLPTA